MSLQTEGPDLIEPVFNDRFDDLTEGQQQTINRSIEKLDKGERIPNAEVVARLGL